MRTNTIIFSSDEPSVEVLRLSKDGIWANPDVPADEAAKLVLEAIHYNIKVLVQKAVEDEREACAKLEIELILSPAFFATMGEYDAHKDAVLAYRNLIRARP